MITEIKDPVFKAYIVCYIGMSYNDFVNAVSTKTTNADPGIFPRCGGGIGGNFTLRDEGTGSIMYNLWVESMDDVATLYHEVFHLSLNVMRDRQIPVDFTNHIHEEAIAYYGAFLFESLITKIIDFQKEQAHGRQNRRKKNAGVENQSDSVREQDSGKLVHKNKGIAKRVHKEGSK